MTKICGITDDQKNILNRAVEVNSKHHFEDWTVYNFIKSRLNIMKGITVLEGILDSVDDFGEYIAVTPIENRLVFAFKCISETGLPYLFYLCEGNEIDTNRLYIIKNGVLINRAIIDFSSNSVEFDELDNDVLGNWARRQFNRAYGLPEPESRVSLSKELIEETFLRR